MSDFLHALWLTFVLLFVWDCLIVPAVRSLGRAWRGEGRWQR